MGLIIIACVSAVVTSSLIVIVFVVIIFVVATYMNDPTAGEAVQLLLLFVFVWPAAIASGAISMVAIYLFFNKSFRKRPLLFSTISGIVGVLLPLLLFVLYSISI
jgi:hypothetical protein